MTNRAFQRAIDAARRDDLRSSHIVDMALAAADPLRPADTDDDEPWDVPGPDEQRSRRWLVFAALAVAIVLLGLVRVR